MFEELDPKNQSGAGNQSVKAPENLFEKNINSDEKKVDDIFRDTELAQKPPILQPKSASQIAGEKAALAEEEKKLSLRNLLYLTIAAAILLAIAIGGYIFIAGIMKKNQTIEKNLIDQTPVDQEAQMESNIETDNNYQAEEPSNEADQNNIISSNEEASELDSDQDGLLDSEERSLGTDIDSIDSDGDGLFDREEVHVYKTNPLIDDTDKDGYSDGEEVKNGYNPIGTGKLFELPGASNL
jgi:hypothetical protein